MRLSLSLFPPICADFCTLWLACSRWCCHSSGSALLVFSDRVGVWLLGRAGMTLRVRCRTRRRQSRCRVPRGRRREHCRPTRRDTESPPVRFCATIISFAVHRAPLLLQTIPTELVPWWCRLHEQAGDVGSALQGPVGLPRCRAAGPPACTRCFRLGDTPHPTSLTLTLPADLCLCVCVCVCAAAGAAGDHAASHDRSAGYGPVWCLSCAGSS